MVLQKLSSNRDRLPAIRDYGRRFLSRIRDLNAAMTHYQEGIKRQPKEKHTYQKRIIEVIVKQNKKDEASNS